MYAVQKLQYIGRIYDTVLGMHGIFAKSVSFSEPWRPQYREVQRQINHALTKVLHTNNGIVPQAFVQERFSASEISRLFTVFSPDKYEWLHKIQSIEKVAHQLHVSPEALPPWLVSLFTESRSLIARREFPHLVPKDHDYFIRQEDYGQVYGLSVLLRPLATIVGGFVPRDDIRISSNHLVVYFHHDLDNPDPEQSFTRVMFSCGKELPVDFRTLIIRLRPLKNNIFAALQAQQYDELVKQYAQVVNKYIEDQYVRKAQEEEDDFSIMRYCFSDDAFEFHLGIIPE